jgi:hypothetical protein
MTYAEPMVARVIGVQKSRLVSVRKLKLARDVDWLLEKAVVVYTEAGLAKILVELGLANGAFLWPTAENEGQAGCAEREAEIEATDGLGEAIETEVEPEKIAVIAAAVATFSPGELVSSLAIAIDKVAARSLVDLVLVRTSRNPMIVYATPAAGGEEVPVKVANNAHFIPGMHLTARAPVEGSSLYYLEGRVPRWRGRY